MSVASAGRLKQKDTYLSLIRRFPLRPLRSETELDDAIEMINSLIDKGKLDQDQRDYLAILADIVERFERDHIPMPQLPDDVMLRFLIEGKGATQSEVSKECKIAESTISEVLSGRRKLNRKQVERLSCYFGVEPTVFLSSN